MRVTLAAPAKVNLWLRVGPPEASGYHGIDTLFCSLHLADTVVIRPGAGTPALEIDHALPLQESPELGPDRDNLAVRAARAFMDRAGLDRGPDIRLVKRIPAGAGLGGGSSDAAAVLRGMARLHPGAVTGEQLMELGSDLGSDVPFFVQGAPLAHGTGRGERISALSPLSERHVVVAIPEFPVSTAAAYQWLDEDRDADASLSRESGPVSDGQTWDALAHEAMNDFEGPVFRRHPPLEALRDRLRELGARPALLAGSGSTVFGVFGSRGEARGAATAIEESDPTVRVVVTRTRTR